MRTVRLFSILDILRSRRGPVPASTLADLLQVTERTIYRDMVTLKDMGAPIRGESGLGYVIERGYFLPPMQFDPDELDVMLLGIRMVKARGDTEMRETAERELGRKIVANIVMLGFVAANTDVVSINGIREAVLSSIPKGTEELNTQALERGYTYDAQRSEKIAKSSALHAA